MSDFVFGAGPIIWVQQTFGPAWEPAFRTLTLLGSTWGVIFGVGLALWLWGREEAYPLVAILLVETATNLLLNQIVQLPRPDAPGIIAYERVPMASFPSGHVYTAAAVWGLLYARGRVSLALAAALVAGTALARLYLGVHYVGDVLGGAVFGALLVAVFVRLWPAARRWLGERPPAFFWWLSGVALAGACIAFTLLGGNAAAWNAAAVAAAAAIALPLEHHFGRGVPDGDGARWRIALAGAAGLIPLLVIDRLSGERALALGAATCFVATTWAVLLIPLAFRRGASADSPARRERGMAAWKRVLAGLAGVLGILLFYGVVVEPRVILDVEEEVAHLPGLPARWEGQTVAVIADFQVGMWGANTGMARRAVREAVARRPAAVLLAGDFIYKPDADPRELVREVTDILEPLARSGIPAYAVLGNHDWGLNRKHGSENPLAARRVLEGLERAGIRVLHNQAVPLAPPGGVGTPLYVVGVGSRWAGEDRPAEALRGVPAGAPRVVLMHNPDSFQAIPAGMAPLAVSGHTHGGQVALPFLPAWSWLAITTRDEVHADGWAKGYGAPGNRLYVNRGIGFSTVAIRINAPPELTLFTLRRAR